METIELISYSISLVLSASIMMMALSRSAFGVPLFFTELAIVAGLSLYPLLFLLGIVSPGIEGELFLAHNAAPDAMTALHVLLWSVGGFVGYVAGSSRGVGVINRLSRTVNNARFNQVRIFNVLVTIGLLVYVLFFFLVGWRTALANAAAARSGIFEGFGEGASWLFLKTLAGMALLGSAVYLPFVLNTKGKYLSVFMYFLLVVIAYLNSISRNLLLAQVVIPVAIYLYMQPNRGLALLQKSLIAFFLSTFAVMVLLFGKSFGLLLQAFVSDVDSPWVLQSYQGDDGIFYAFMRNVEHQWFTIAAGIDHFFDTGVPLFPQDALLAAVFGFVPSRIMAVLGLEFLYYGNAEIITACVNTHRFGDNACTIPIGWYGLSAYTFPIIGGLVFNVFRMYLFGGLERLWRRNVDRSFRNVWVPYLGFTIISGYLSMIPSVCAVISAILLSIVFFVTFRSFIRSAVGLGVPRTNARPHGFREQHPM